MNNIMIDAVAKALGLQPTLDALKSPETLKSLQEALYAVRSFDARLRRIENAVSAIVDHFGIVPADSTRDDIGTMSSGIVTDA